MAISGLGPAEKVDLEVRAQRAADAGDHRGAFELLQGQRQRLGGEWNLVLLLVENAARAGLLSRIPPEWLRAVGEGRPGLTASLLDLCLRLRRESRPAAAAELAGLLTDLDPFHAPAWHERARCSLALDEERWAYYFCRRALAVDPDYGPAAAELEGLEGRSGRPIPPELHFAEAARLLGQGRRLEALRLIEGTLVVTGRGELARALLELVGRSREEEIRDPGILP